MGEQLSAAESAYRTLRDAILDGAHRSGEMLGEAGLAAERITEHADARLILETTAAARVHPDRRDAHASALERSVREQEEAFRAGARRRP